MLTWNTLKGLFGGVSVIWKGLLVYSKQGNTNTSSFSFEHYSFLSYFTRMAAEELYIKSLSGISRLSSVAEPEACPYFGQEKSTFELATFQYELSLDKLITSRREFIQAMKTQIDVLVMVRVSSRKER